MLIVIIIEYFIKYWFQKGHKNFNYLSNLILTAWPTYEQDNGYIHCLFIIKLLSICWWCCIVCSSFFAGNGDFNTFK